MFEEPFNIEFDEFDRLEFNEQKMLLAIMLRESPRAREALHQIIREFYTEKAEEISKKITQEIMQ